MNKFHVLKYFGLILGLCSFLLQAQSLPSFEEGKHYERLTTAQPTKNPNQVEVLEYFSYGCPHCFTMEPYIESWLAKKPKNADFHRMHAVFSRIHKLFARAFYTAEVLGVLETTHKAFFEAIHKEKRNLRSLDAIADFYSKHGVDKKKFLSTAESFAVDTKLTRSETLSPRYQITGVPTIIVNGKYKVMANKAGGYEQMMDVINYLIRLESTQLKLDNATDQVNN